MAISSGPISSAPISAQQAAALEGISGTLNKTLADVLLSGLGKLDLTGALSKTLAKPIRRATPT